MAKNTNKIIAGALALVGVYFIFKYFKKPSKTTAPVEPAPTGGATTTPIPVSSGFPMKKGSKGKNVAAVQQWLLKIDKTLLPKYGADGDFGSETEAAVQKVLGKKTVDSNADIDKLMLIYNQKTFPLMIPKTQPQNQLPTFPYTYTK